MLRAKDESPCCEKGLMWLGVEDRRETQSVKARLGLFLVILTGMETADEPAEHSSRTEMRWAWEEGLPRVVKRPRPQEKGRNHRAWILTQNSVKP